MNKYYYSFTSKFTNSKKIFKRYLQMIQYCNYHICVIVFVCNLRRINSSSVFYQKSFQRENFIKYHKLETIDAYKSILLFYFISICFKLFLHKRIFNENQYYI